MKKQSLLLASGNPGKLTELRALSADLPLVVTGPESLQEGLPEVDETGTTFLENATLKALSAAETATKKCKDNEVIWALADDSGLMVDYLNGAPGVHSARFSGISGEKRDAANNEMLLEKLKGVPPEKRMASFWCVLALAKPGEILLAVEGSVEGWILDRPRGESGFGYDPLFYHEPSDRTFAELSAKEKAAISHRSRAMTRLQAALESILA